MPLPIVAADPAPLIRLTAVVLAAGGIGSWGALVHAAWKRRRTPTSVGNTLAFMVLGLILAGAGLLMVEGAIGLTRLMAQSQRAAQAAPDEMRALVAALSIYDDATLADHLHPDDAPSAAHPFGAVALEHAHDGAPIVHIPILSGASCAALQAALRADPSPLTAVLWSANGTAVTTVSEVADWNCASVIDLRLAPNGTMLPPARG